MFRIILTALTLPLVLLFAPPDIHSSNPAANRIPANQGQSGTLQKMIVASGSVTMDIDLNRLNGNGSTTGNLETLHFAIAANSFFPVLVFNNALRGPQAGSMELKPLDKIALPPALTASLKRLSLAKLDSSEPFDMAVRDAMSGFGFFNVQGNLYQYDANAQSLSIHGGRLLISKEFATALGRRSDAGLEVGKISVETIMQPIEVTKLSNGTIKSVLMPPLIGPNGGPRTAAQGPDVIVGDLPEMAEFGSSADGTQVGLGVGTTSCNNGNQPIDWFALSNTDHPVIPQNFYRMSGGTNNNDRFEQIGQSWMKHAFEALEDDQCGFGCNITSNCTPGSQLCPGCSDTYGSGLNADQNGIGSRAWVNPFSGAFPSNANDHTGHVHDGVSHRVLVETNDLNQTMNQGATYFAEAQYVAPSEYTWCQAHPGQCNMYNNASYRPFQVTGTTNFTFSPLGSTVRTQPAIEAWAGTGATVTEIQPAPGDDGIWFLGYKVTNPTTGVYHYEYALYNQNLDRAIQSFSVPLGAGVTVSNIGFHAPPQHPGWANDGTFMNQGYSSTPWAVTQASDSITWNSETFAQNQNANAIRWGTMYNFRFDSNQPPHTTSGTVGFFKTGSPIPVLIEAPVLADATPTPTPTASPSVTPTPTSTPTSTATPTPTGTPPACTVVNGGFETGSFPPWTISGDTSFTAVNTVMPHSGLYSEQSGPTSSDGFTDQVLPTVAGQAYDVTFWLANADTSSTNRFGASLGSVTLVPEAAQGVFGYTLYTFNNVIPGANADLHFIFYNVPSYFYLDDVCVTPSTSTPTPTPTPTATPTATATATPAATATATATPTPTSTPRPTPTPRSQPTPRPRPTPPPRP